MESEAPSDDDRERHAAVQQRWAAADVGSPGVFREWAASVVFRPEVPDVVEQRFRAVRDLLLHSAASWTFPGLAFERALLTLETALRLRHHARHGSDPHRGRPGLLRLYRWAARERLVTLNESWFDTFYKLRNDVAHPVRATAYTGPGGAMNLIWLVVDVVNELFEDPTAREERAAEYTWMEERLRTLTAAGAEWVQEGDRRALYRVDLLSAEDRLPDREVAVALWPTFAGSTDGGRSHDLDSPVVVRCRAISGVRDGLVLAACDGEEDALLLGLSGSARARHLAWRDAQGDLCDVLTRSLIQSIRRDEADDVARRVRAHWTALRTPSAPKP